MFLFVALLAFAAVGASASSAHKRMLGFVPGLYDGALDLASTGFYEKKIEHVDVYGGFTRSHTVVKLRQDRFVMVRDAADSADSAAAFELVSCTADDVIVRALRDDESPVYGDILIGTAMTRCCALAEEAKHSGAGPAPFDMQLALHSLCGRQVESVSKLESDGAYRVRVVDVDVMPLIDHLSVQFHHSPGNASDADARHELQRRGDFIDLNRTSKFDNIRWNYDDKTDGAKSKDFEIPFTAFNGFPSVCNECFFDFKAQLDFELLVSRTMWGLPKVQLLRVLFTGDLQVASRISVTIPYSRNLISFSKDLAPRVEVSKIVVPAGPFGITLKLSFGPVLTAAITASAQVTVSHGSRSQVKMQFGFMWKNGQGLPDLIVDSQTKNSFPASTIGPFGVSPVMEKKLTFSVGVSVTLRVNVGLNWLPLAFVPLLPGPEFFAVSVGVGPRIAMSVKYLNDLKCPGYELTRGISLGTTISAIFIKIGRWKIGFSQFLGFPFFGLVDLFKQTVPEGCDVCRACLPLEDKLPPFAQKLLEFASKNPEMGATLMLPRIQNISVALVGASNYTLGRQLTLAFTAPASTKKVFVAVERMRKDDKYNPEEPDQFPLYTGALKQRSIDLSALGVGELSKLTFEARAFAPDLKAGDRLRIYVCDNDNEEIFGSTDWMAYVAPAAMPTSKFWLYSGWSDCIQECGPESQTRTAFCVNEFGGNEDGCDMAAKEELTRDCANPSCTFQALSIMVPADGAIEKGDDKGNMKISVQGNGGLPNVTYDVRICADALGPVSCDEPKLDELRCLLVGQARPGERKDFPVSLDKFKLERQKLRLLAAKARVLLSIAGEDVYAPALAARRAWSGVFTMTVERRYKLDTPDKVPSPKAWLAVGSAGVTDGKQGDSQNDIGEILYVWASPEWVNRTDIGGTVLVLSSPDPLLGGPAVGSERLALTFDKATGISTCSPHDGQLSTGTPVCKPAWTNAKELRVCPDVADAVVGTTVTAGLDDHASVVAGVAGGAAIAAAAATVF
jgi:hypothetical protein